MSRARLTIVGLLALFAVSAATASSASAFSWWVETKGGGEEVLKEGIKAPFDKAATVHAPFRLKWNATTEVVCAAASYEEGFIEGFVGLGAKAIKFESCGVSKPTGCEVEGTTIKTSELTGRIKLTGGGVGFELEPKVGPTFAKFKLLGTGCAQTVEVTGTAHGELTNPAELSKEKLFAFLNTKAGTKGGLLIGSKAVESNEGEVGYSASKGWSAH